MKKFTFRFETILKVRKLREEEGLRALSVAQRAHQAEIARKQNALDQLDAALKRRENAAFVSESSNRSIEMLAIELEQKFIIGCKQRIAQAERAIIKASRSVEKSLRTYLQLRRQSKMMENLYDKDYAEFKKAYQKREAKIQDEFSTMRAFHREKELA